MKVNIDTNYGRYDLELSPEEIEKLEKANIPLNSINRYTYDEYRRIRYELIDREIEEREARLQAEKVSKYLNEESIRTSSELSSYNAVPYDDTVFFETAIVGNCTLLISKPQYALLDSSLFKNRLYFKDFYETTLSDYETIQILGSIGFKVVAISGDRVILSKKMIRLPKEE